MQKVELRGVYKSYGPVEVIANLSFQVETGSFTALLGPSGCGKFTLLRMIAGLKEISRGQCFIDGRDVTRTRPAKRGVAMVFQNYALYPDLTVCENIGFSLSIAGVKKAVRDERVAAVARSLRLIELLGRRPRRTAWQRNDGLCRHADRAADRPGRGEFRRAPGRQGERVARRQPRSPVRRRWASDLSPLVRPCEV
jgi:ABC-type taurine transport system ATPase subunit